MKSTIDEGWLRNDGDGNDGTESNKGSEVDLL